MKKVLCLLIVVLILLLTGCTAVLLTPQTEPETQPPQTELPTQPKQFSDDPAIAAVWVNGGKTSDGEDYVETMSLLPNGAALISIDYQSGAQTLNGTYTALDGVLTVYIDDETPYEKTYQYELDANVLTLISDKKTVTYRRSD